MERDALKEKLASLPTAPGVYLFKDAGGVVMYIGKAKSLRSRVSSYFQEGARHTEKTASMVAQVADFDVMEAASEVDAFLMESRLIKDVQPKYNVRLRDAKTFPFIQIRRSEDYPRVEITRTPVSGTRLFGPFSNVRDLRAALGLMQQVFRFRTCHLDIDESDARRRYARPCILYHIKRCLGPCAALCTREAYDTAIGTLTRFLSGRRQAVLKELERKMLKASRELRYEDAAHCRDEIKALKALDQRSRFTDNPEFYALPADLKSAGDALAKLFGLKAPVRVIEGIDISNIAGQDAVGSVVTFIDGAPFRRGYRRYKIRTVEGSDDYAMIREVVSRRYRRLKAEDDPLPDLVLIDGGRGQLHAAAEALDDVGVSGPYLVSLAKREEEIFTTSDDAPLRLQRNTKTLRLLQCVRDEAHRFALHYHKIVRTKRTIGERRGGRRKKGLDVAVGGKESGAGKEGEP